VLGPTLADRTYANLYVQVVGFKELHLRPLARLESIKAGLMDLAGQGSYEGILSLQEFACARRDAEALRRAQALWKAYATEPQLRGPRIPGDAGLARKPNPDCARAHRGECATRFVESQLRPEDRKDRVCERGRREGVSLRVGATPEARDDA
jgi:hypothetical protein